VRGASARIGIIGVAAAMIPIIGIIGVMACSKDELAPLDRLAQPTGMAQSPDGDRLFVTNGNWDRSHTSSGLVVLDLAALEAGLAQPRGAGASLDGSRPCRAHAQDDRLECDPSLLIDPELGVRLPSGAGNIAMDRPGGEQGPLRLLIPTRVDPGVTWVDVLGEGLGDSGPLRLDCGQAEDRACDRGHRLDEIGDDPSRLSVDDQGFRYAYLPHLLGGRLTLIALDGDRGPEVVDIQTEFFRDDELFDSGLGGGFSVIQRACDLDAGNVPALSLECARPFLLATQRYWWGLRSFRVAPGLDVLLAGNESTVLGPNLEAAEPKPLMGGMAFEDPEQGDRLLVVHTTPPALSRVDTSLDEDDGVRVEVVATVSLCTNPNLVSVHRPSLDGGPGPSLALVSCYGSDQLAVGDLNVFVVVATLELLIDDARDWLLVANTAESTISIVDLDAGRSSYLTEFATLGLGTPARAK
jgi:hypothetical protein